MSNPNKKTGRSKAGRPTKRTPSRVAKILELSNRKTDEEVAKIIGVNPSTIFRWKKLDLEFCMAVNQMKQEANEMVVGSLFKSAVGYDYEESTETKEGTFTHTKHAKPDVRAIQFWLKNRQPKRWKDRVELTHEAGTSLLLNLGNGQKKFDV